MSREDEEPERREAAAPAIELRGVCKSFGPVRANIDVSISVRRGAVHGIVGENGAGKSTLMSILYGFHRADSGRVLIDGRETAIPDTQAAIAAGVGMVFQHFKLVENFTVLENIVLGAEDGPLLRPSLAKARSELARLAEEYGLDVDPDAVIEDVGVGMRQRVEILKALYRRAEILILDEPTGVLTPSEADRLFEILKRLREEGKTVLLVTHKLREVMKATDDVSVMRAGQMVATLRTADTSPEEIAALMVGRKVLLRVEKGAASPGAPALEAEDLRAEDDQGVERLRGVSLRIRRGEILGIAGVAGNGQTELLEVLGGSRAATGALRVGGREIALSGHGADGRGRRAAGVAHVPEDRQRQGLIMDFAAWENMALGYHRDPRWQRGPLLDTARMRADAEGAMARFDVRPADPDLPAGNFSGGNQQKIVLAREIDRDPDVLLVGQPTRGVDIGAIEFIHRRIIELRDAGKAILLVSVELDEIMSLSDRIAVMFGGRIMGERSPGEADETELGLLMAGFASGSGGAAAEPRT